MNKEAMSALLLGLAAATAAMAADSPQPASGDDWPPQRQKLLAGRYVGKLQGYTRDCETVRADLRLEVGSASETVHRYTLTTTCITGAGRQVAPRTITGVWGIDQMASSCLTLGFEDPDGPQVGPNIYGFRVEEAQARGRRAAAADYDLAQDGINCHSGMPPEHADKRLRRVR
ncbi:hypothetical protein [Xanthomonas sp. WHRI 7945]|nr:hypothetical protein [Xanthomonas campestris pv. campestris]